MSNNIFFERGKMADKPNNYLWNGDCLELMKDIPDKSMDAIICDLPYGTTANKWDSIIPFDLLWDEYNRIAKDNGAIVLFGNEPFSSALRISNKKIYKYDWKWIKQIPSNHLNAKKQPLRSYEDVMIFYKKQCTYNPILTDKPKSHIRENPIDIKVKNNGGIGKVKENVKRNEFRTIPLDKNYPLNVLNIDTLAKNKRIHTTQKPLELIKYLVSTYTNENDWVLDNTCGSNTTGIACYDLNRNYIGIEKDIDIYNVAKERVEKNILLRANEQQTLFKDKQ
jgi:DNA modification methylase